MQFVWIAVAAACCAASLYGGPSGKPERAPRVKPAPSASAGAPSDLAAESGIVFSSRARELLDRNGFVVVPGVEKDFVSVYANCRVNNQGPFITTDALLATANTFLDRLMRILETEHLVEIARSLTYRMLDISRKQLAEAKNAEVREAARANVSYFSVPTMIFNPTAEPDESVQYEVEAELDAIAKQAGLQCRASLLCISNPALFRTPYAYADYSRFKLSGHYTLNEELKKYFTVLTWYGLMDFKLRPTTQAIGISHGRKMTLQALLIADACKRDSEVRRSWETLYTFSTLFHTTANELSVDAFLQLMERHFKSVKSIDQYAAAEPLTAFIDDAMRITPPQTISRIAVSRERVSGVNTRSFRFMGLPTSPDAFVFRELVFFLKDGKSHLMYTGNRKPLPFTAAPIAIANGVARAYPRGLDFLAVLGSRRAAEILESDGDTQFTSYPEQLMVLQAQFAALTTEAWEADLYARRIHALVPLLAPPEGDGLPEFMQNRAWLDKQLQTSLGAWVQLKHATAARPARKYRPTTVSFPKARMTYGYVEPHPEVYTRIAEMMDDLDSKLTAAGMIMPKVTDKVRAFSTLAEQLEAVAEKVLRRKVLDDADYRVMWEFGPSIQELLSFPEHFMKKVAATTDERTDIVTSIFTDLRQENVLSQAVGTPSDIYVVVRDRRGTRLCRGGMFSYYEFKQSAKAQWSDEQWQATQQNWSRQDQPLWTYSFTANGQ